MIHYSEIIKYHCNPQGLRETYKKTVDRFSEIRVLDSALLKADWVDRYYLMKIVDSYRQEHPSLSDLEVLSEIGNILEQL